MKYHVSVDCEESYIFPRGYIFPKRTAAEENIITRENITIGTTDTWFFIRPGQYLLYFISFHFIYFPYKIQIHNDI